mgnify:CR=1 FL=1
MRQGQDNRQIWRRGTCAIGTAVLLVTALVAAIPPCATVNHAAGPTASGGASAARGEIAPLEQTRTLHVAANMWYGGEEQCDIEDEDAADDFGDTTTRSSPTAPAAGAKPVSSRPSPRRS